MAPHDLSHFLGGNSPDNPGIALYIVEPQAVGLAPHEKAGDALVGLQGKR